MLFQRPELLMFHVYHKLSISVEVRTVQMSATYCDDVCHRVHRIINSYNITSFGFSVCNRGNNVTEILHVDRGDDVLSSSNDIQSLCVTVPSHLGLGELNPDRNNLWVIVGISSYWKWCLSHYFDVIISMKRKELLICKNLKEVMENVFFSSVRKSRSHNIS